MSLRVTGGHLRGRRVAVPTGARPSTESLREACFSILGQLLEGHRVLDLCAGSGMLAIEAMSRGAERAVLVEYNGRTAATLRRTLKELGLGTQSRVVRGDCLKFVEKSGELEYDVAFADPPYESDLAERLVDAWRSKPFSRVFVLEHRKVVSFGAGIEKTYGDSRLSIFENEGAPQ